MTGPERDGGHKALPESWPEVDEAEGAEAKPIPIPKRLLVVEDDPDLREILKDVLVLGGFDVVTVADGAEAVSLIKRAAYSLVLTDIRLPRLSGLDIARFVQGLPRPTKVILITAYPVWQFEKELEDLRVAAVLSKPFDLLVLLRTVEEVLRDSSDGDASI